MSTINADARILDCALLYAKRWGWAIFPVHVPIHDDAGACVGCTCEHYRRSEECKANHPKMYLGPDGKCEQPGKCPAVRWRDKSTTDEAQIRKWWGKPWRAGAVQYFPNIGLDCGKSNILTLDADAYKESYAGADLLNQDDRQTVTALTGGGGEHLVYDRQGLPYGNDTQGLPEGLDIRGAGGYIVATPSLHKSGRRYQWEANYGPHETRLQPIPEALRSILDKAHQHKTTVAVTFGAARDAAPGLAQWELSDHTLDMIHSPAAKGQRSEHDASVITALCAAGASDDDVLAVFSYYPVGLDGKFAERGDDYLARTIGNCRAWLAEQEAERQRFLAMLEYGLTWVLENNFADVWPELRTPRRFKSGDGYVERMVYPTDSRDTKAAFFVLSEMLKHKSATVYITRRAGADGAGMDDSTYERALAQLHGRLFTVTAEPGKVTIVTLNMDFASREWTTCYQPLQDHTPIVSELVHPRETKIYAARMNTDPYLTGTSRKVKERARQIQITEHYHAVMAATTIEELPELRTIPEILADMPKGLGETILRIHALEAHGTLEEIGEAIGKSKSAVWRALSYVESLGGAESTREGPRTKKVYCLVPDFDEWVTRLAPAMRTAGLASERKDRHLKEAQLWAKREESKAQAAGDQEAVRKAQHRFTRLGNQRLEPLAHIYPEMASAERATLAFDVPLTRHPATVQKIKEADRQQRKRDQLELLAQMRTWHEQGVTRQEAVRMLLVAGYGETVGRDDYKRLVLPGAVLGALGQVWRMFLMGEQL